jgi:GNAT superfamily N-acetyltransferase
MIEQLAAADAGTIFTIVNEAAVAYRGHIPDDCWHEPYMPRAELRRELRRVTFFGWREPESGRLVGVMGFEKVLDVTLVRHAYVLPDFQGRGIGAALLDYLKTLTETRRLLVGTWRDAVWAVRFYERRGFRLLPDKDALLEKYWDIPRRQIETSVVLGIEL